jgi:glycosyltransferase involved in cell wall biosynthesis
MRIAFYAPLKAPGHPVPSGDRLMARMLVRCLEMAGHEVSIASDLRAYLGDPEDVAGWSALQAAAQSECARIVSALADSPPDIWFSYHPYYKAPDLIGPALADRFGLPIVTCETSYSARRNLGIWAEMQARALAMAKGAALNLCLTARDEAGLLAVDPDIPVARFPPFIDTGPFQADPNPAPGHLMTVAMMRPGDKFQSYFRLAAALKHLPDRLPWRLSVVGDGTLRRDVQGLFAGLPEGRIDWLGEMTRDDVARQFAQAAVYVWPGCGEAYGLAYLEAQAAGLPVVALAVAGVPEVVENGLTGILVPDGNDAAFAAAIQTLLEDEALRARLGRNARMRVMERHSLTGAADRLNTLLRGIACR